MNLLKNAIKPWNLINKLDVVLDSLSTTECGTYSTKKHWQVAQGSAVSQNSSNSLSLVPGLSHLLSWRWITGCVPYVLWPASERPFPHKRECHQLNNKQFLYVSCAWIWAALCWKPEGKGVTFISFMEEQLSHHQILFNVRYKIVKSQ